MNFLPKKAVYTNSYSTPFNKNKNKKMKKNVRIKCSSVQATRDECDPS